jgi:hypothetical protein
MRDIHTVKEWLDIAGFNDAGAVLFEALRMNGTRKGIVGHKETTAAS